MPYQEPPEQVLTTTKLRKDKYSADGKQVWNQYERGEQVGRGQHGVVYKGWDLANNRREVAIKVVKRNNPRNERLNKLRRRRLPSSPGHLPLSHQLASQEHKIKKEIAIMKKCRHAHVVLLYEVIDDPLFNKIYMVMEYLGGGEVKWRNKNEEPVLRVDQARRITRDVVLGLEYLHYQGIIHRDIKPANLMWTPDRRTVKITDFGVSHFSYAQRLAVAGKNPEAEDPILLDESDLSKTAGTPTFMAPEVIQDLTSESFISSNTTSPSQSQTGISLHDTSTVQLPVKARAAITKAIDVWALGVTIYCLLFGKPPFLSPLANEFQLYNVIAKEDWTLPPTMGADQIPTGKRFRPYKPPVEGQPPRDPPKIKIPNSEGAVVVNLLERLLDKNPATRMTLDELKVVPF
ncbi:kinase-like protein, partial [Punctularia strigosozonata HHB-11173 SS5]|uniref:kinase-like protein n=1 Tax=Punctularia strigosozonata (strain HHB-11173) TaxID=741275 RepID=UPI0004418373